MKTQCPHCGSFFDITASDINQLGECGACGKNFIMHKYAESSASAPKKLQINNTSQNAQTGNIINCPACGGKVSKNAPTCPQCGEKISLGKCRNAKLGKFFVILTLIFLVVAFIFGSSKSDSTEFVKLIFNTCIIGIIITLVAMAVCFTSPSGR